MTYEQLVLQIPAHYRTEILSLNAIQNAKPDIYDGTMQYLAEIWKEYVDPNVAMNCNACMNTILKDYKGLQSTFIALEQKGNLLNS